MQAVLFRDVGPLAWASAREHLATRPWAIRVGLQAPLTAVMWIDLAMVRGFEHEQRRTIVYLTPLRAPQRRGTPRPRARPAALLVLIVAATGCLVLMDWLRAAGLAGLVTVALAAVGLSLLAVMVLAGVEGQFAPPAADWQLSLLVLEGDDWPVEDVLDLVRTRVPWGDTVRLLPTNDEEDELCRRLGAEPVRARTGRMPSRDRWVVARAPVPGAPVEDRPVTGPVAIAPPPGPPEARGLISTTSGSGTADVPDGPRPRWVGSALVWSSEAPTDDTLGMPDGGRST